MRAVLQLAQLLLAAVHCAKVAREVPWWAKKEIQQNEWKKELRRRGVQFQIGQAACNRRSRSACLLHSAPPQYSEARALPRCANASGEQNGWAGWAVPEVLRRQGVSSGDPALYRPLLRKLQSGAPVTLLALGSSVVGAHAGCTAPWPLLRNCPCPRCCGSRCGRWGGGGWGLRVLRSLNATWPHAGHRLLNLGEPGGDLMPSLLACPRSFLDFEPDIVFLDFFTA